MRLRPWPLVFLLSATATVSYLCRVNISVAAAISVLGAVLWLGITPAPPRDLTPSQTTI